MVHITDRSQTETNKADEAEAEFLDGLIARVAERDREALAELYRRTASSVYAFALSVLKDSHGAEDVMQDTYVSIAQNSGGYRSQGKPTAWILTIAKNLALSRLGRSENKNVSLEEFEDISSQNDQYSAADRRILIKTAMSCLSDEERQIVSLHAVAGLKHREIGELTGLPLATVLTKYNRALAKMKKTLGGGSYE